jgi:hypothetical protein
MKIIVPATRFTRPADTTAYAVGDHVANSTTAGSVTPLTFSLKGVNMKSRLIGARIIRGSTAVDMAFRLWLYNDNPAADGAYIADNAAFAGINTLAALNKVVGQVSVATGDFVAGTSAAIALGYPTVSPVVDSSIDKALYGLLEARTAVALGNAETFDVALFLAPII